MFLRIWYCTLCTCWQQSSVAPHHLFDGMPTNDKRGLRRHAFLPVHAARRIALIQHNCHTTVVAAPAAFQRVIPVVDLLGQHYLASMECTNTGSSFSVHAFGSGNPTCSMVVADVNNLWHFYLQLLDFCCLPGKFPGTLVCAISFFIGLCHFFLYSTQ
ncbi:hypothetical protein PAHAL_8G059600 [Panicum hallii]|uniref:Uncharacterized protein n=1 Tax=Panicum hallii TaxID=206008 RepID=A0A2T8I7Y1_9POAL|nr:hypothetical protein PAHAL_8G059600 [Panicum hallii]